jgi:hypothetical protein
VALVPLILVATSCADEALDLVGRGGANPVVSIVNVDEVEWVHREGQSLRSVSFRPNGRFEAKRGLLNTADRGRASWQLDQGTYEIESGKVLLHTQTSSCGCALTADVAFGLTGASLVLQTSGGALVFKQEKLDDHVKTSLGELCVERGWLGPKRDDQQMNPPGQGQVLPAVPSATRDLPEGHFATCGREIENPVNSKFEYWDWQRGAIDLDGRGAYWVEDQSGTYEGNKQTGTLSFKTGPLASSTGSSYDDRLDQIHLGTIGVDCDRSGSSLR